jgi:Ca2+-binding EF-hand superfamily protein
MDTYTDIRNGKNTIVDYKRIDFKTFLDIVLSEYHEDLDEEYEYAKMIDCGYDHEFAISFGELYKIIKEVYECYYSKSIQDTLDMLVRLLKTATHKGKFNVQYVTNY